MGKLRGIWRECFRYKLSGVGLVVCLVLSMLAAYYGITIYKNIYMEYQEKMEYEYQYATFFKCYIEDLSNIPSLPEGVDCNLKIVDCSMYSDLTNSTILVNIIINSSHENWPLVSGHFASERERAGDDRPIVIGRSRFELAYESGGEYYYRLFGDEYKVVGVIGSKNSVAYDGCNVLYLDCLGENALEQLIPDGDNPAELYFVLESNTLDTREIFNRYISGTYNAVTESYRSYVHSTAEPVYNEKKYCITIYLFCFISIYIVARFWLDQRRHELQVCRACGFSDRQLVQRILRSFGCILAVSALFTLVCVLALNLIMGVAAKEYRLGFSWSVVPPYLFVLASSLFLAGARAVRFMLEKNIHGI